MENQILTRTYIRAVSIDITTGRFELPMWKPNVIITLALNSIPFTERSRLHPGFRCNVDANLDATTEDHLGICNWGLY